VFRRTDALFQRTLVHWAGYATLGIFSLLLALVLLSDIARAVYVLARWTMQAQPSPLDPRALSLTILGAAGVLSLIGLVQARCPRLVEIDVKLDGLPEDLDGYRIVQWSDVHVGPTIQRRFVQSLVDRTNALEPDAVAITGDFADGFLDDLREQVQPLRDLRTRDGLFYVTGNHEYYWRVSEWTAELERLGATFLQNEHRTISVGNAQLVFAGVTDPVGRDSHKPDPMRALAGVPRHSIKVLLSHRPQTAQQASALGVDLQLSGHTHGGQFFPFNLLIHFFQPIVSGLHRVGRTWLYVNRGTGYWGPPSRLGVNGEITLLTLRKA
jgi:predicted MPP superfamily phosphohydrolase